MTARPPSLSALLVLLALACGDGERARDPTGTGDAAGPTDAGPGDGDPNDGGPPGEGPLPYARNVVVFSPGAHAGFGQDAMPDVVLGPPGAASAGGSLDVVSLGVGGEIVLDFGDRDVVDGPGADFVIFENPFYAGGDPTQVFAELGEVAVSLDGETWTTFACDVEGQGMGRFPGCAGWTPTRVYDPEALVPLDPEVSGGDAFDLAALGVERARFVRIRDRADGGTGNTAGFDLDAMGAVHLSGRL